MPPLMHFCHDQLIEPACLFHALQVQLYQVQLSTRRCTHRTVALLCAVQGDETVEQTSIPEVLSFLSTTQVVSCAASEHTCGQSFGLPNCKASHTWEQQLAIFTDVKCARSRTKAGGLSGVGTPNTNHVWASRIYTKMSPEFRCPEPVIWPFPEKC